MHFITFISGSWARVCCFLPVRVKTNLVFCWGNSRPEGWREVGAPSPQPGGQWGFTAAIGSSSGMGGSRRVEHSRAGGSLARDTSASLRAPGRTPANAFIFSSRAEAHSLSDLQDHKLLVVLLHLGEDQGSFLHCIKSRVVPAYQHLRLCSNHTEKHRRFSGRAPLAGPRAWGWRWPSLCAG